MGRKKENVYFCPICKRNRALLVSNTLFGVDACPNCVTHYQRELTATIDPLKQYDPADWVAPFDPSPLNYGLKHDRDAKLTFSRRMVKQRGRCQLCGATLQKLHVYLCGINVLRSLHCTKCHLARARRGTTRKEAPKVTIRKPLTTKDILARLPWPWLLYDNPHIMSDLQHGV